MTMERASPTTPKPYVDSGRTVGAPNGNCDQGVIDGNPSLGTVPVAEPAAVSSSDHESPDDTVSQAIVLRTTSLSRGCFARGCR